MTQPGFTNIAPEEALRLIREGHIRHVIDTREFNEWTAARIAGSVLTPVPSGEGLVFTRLKELGLPKDEPVLVHCRSGARSMRVMPQVLAYGFTTVYHLPGGILGWVAAGLPVETGPG
jgi:rhodanese-related sulfurtransferase